MFYCAQRLDLFAWCVRLSRLALSRFSNALKINTLSFILFDDAVYLEFTRLHNQVKMIDIRFGLSTVVCSRFLFFAGYLPCRL